MTYGSSTSVATLAPSSALKTEIAGVMTPSPYISAAPNKPMTTSARLRSNAVAPASGINARIPPSPWLSARITKRQYLREIVMTRAHKINERTPRVVSGVNCPPMVWMIACRV
jgi:hypothetical protein